MSVTRLAFWYVICQSASHSWLRGDLRKMRQLPCGEQARSRGSGFSSKKRPRKTGAKSGRNGWGSTRSHQAVFPLYHALRGSEPRIRKVTVADRDAGVSHQQAIDGGHHAAKQRGRRHKAERSSLGHDCSLMATQQVAAVLIGTIKVCQMPDANHLFAWQHIIFCNAPWSSAISAPNKKAAGNRRP